MKNLSLLTKATLAILCIAGLSACGKKKGNTAVAAAPAGYTTCTTGVNPYTGQACQIGTQIYAGNAATTTTCTTGINPYTNQPCQIGSVIYGTQIPGQFPGQFPGQYPGQFPGQFPGGYQQNACSIYQMQYGVPYYPQYYNGQLMCVRAY